MKARPNDELEAEFHREMVADGLSNEDNPRKAVAGRFIVELEFDHRSGAIEGDRENTGRLTVWFIDPEYHQKWNILAQGYVTPYDAGETARFDAKRQYAELDNTGALGEFVSNNLMVGRAERADDPTLEEVFEVLGHHDL
jgi:hypothetical protein